MSLKHLFIEKTEEEVQQELLEKKNQKAAVTKKKAPLPKKEVSEDDSLDFSDFDMEPVTVPASGIPPDIMKKLRKRYRSLFDGLNKTGFDFYEFKNGVEGGKSTPQAYKSVFGMVGTVDSTVTKESMLEDANFYVGQLNLSHDEVNEEGKKKLQDLNSKKDQEESQLTSKKKSIEEKINNLKEELGAVSKNLNEIDSKYGNEMTETKQTLAANTAAKEELVKEIQLVVTGINTHL